MNAKIQKRKKCQYKSCTCKIYDAGVCKKCGHGEVWHTLPTDSPPTRDLLCIICFERYRNTLLLPCKHLISCESCQKRLKECPVCKSSINSVISGIFI